MPQDPATRAPIEKIVEEAIAAEGQMLLGWRDVPVDNSCLSKAPEIVATEPVHRQVFIGRGKDIADEDDFERRLYIVRKVISARIYAESAASRTTSTSCRCRAARSSTRACSSPTSSAPTIATCTTRASRAPLALVHQRFSTNTFPSWQLAHPYRMVAHNGEINTLRGNVNWMAARQASRRFRAVRQRHLEALADLLSRASRTPPASTTRSSSCSAAAIRCRTP